MIKSLTILVLSCIPACAQQTNNDTYGIRETGKTFAKDCQEFFIPSSKLPKDVRVSPRIINDSIYLFLRDPIWLNSIITSKKDGIAIDLVSKEQYTCENAVPFAASPIHKGYLLPPIFKEELEQRLTKLSAALYRIPLGVLPPQFNSRTTEPNFLVIKNKKVCDYTSIVRVDYHGWSLLKTGLYYDTLTKNQLQTKYRDITKSIAFVVPFEKDKVQYKPEDVKPIYDSLNMTDYAIKSIAIRAYTSVEGSYERNVLLQNQRAESIVNALQSYQTEKIASSASADENWVEFLSDIKGTAFDSFFSLSKLAIKEKLKSPDWLQKLEPILRKHRKAIIELTLEKRLSINESNPTLLKKFFDESITRRDIDEALYLQQIIFYKIKKEEIAVEFLNTLAVPESQEYSGLLINNAAFLVENEYKNTLDGITAFEQLNRVFPKNKKINFNLCALKINAWLETNSLINADGLRMEIENLRKLGVPNALVNRMLVNHAIINSKIKLQQRDYLGKDRIVQFIYNSYRTLSLSDADLLNMAKYFSAYSKFDWAIQILLPRVNSINVSEDLLFYYLSLTLYNPKLTANKNYRTTMLNAFSRNKIRFCSFFNSVAEGGISFQLLSDNYLKTTFCENCFSKLN